MKLQEIYNFLNEISPFELQEKWDNSGLIVGDFNKEVSEIILSLDIDEDLIKNAKDGSLFIVHHPLIFSGLKQMDFAKYPANLLQLMIKKDISLIAMHTNFDKTHLNRYVFTHILGFNIDKEQDFILTTYQNFEFSKLLELIKKRLNLSTIKVVNAKEQINGVALTTGAGASLLDFIEVDCFLTGDIKYHDAMKALSEGKTLIDIGHFESERFFVDVMQNLLNSLPISVIIAQSKNPFEIFPL
jgi:dinuclear metal center YbgI/SA1388 family protein